MIRLAFIALLLGLPLAAPAKDEVIYPRLPGDRPGQTPAGQQAGTVPDRLNWLTGVLGLACAAGAGWFWWRQRLAGPAGTTRAERKLTIAETRPLGNRQHLLVADYDGKKYLLGVCPGRIDLLTPLDGQPPAKS